MSRKRGPSAQLRKAREWRRKCPDGWERLVAESYRQQRETGRVSIASAFESMRADERREGRPGRWHLDNSLRPAIARILAESEPLLEPSLEMRESGVDSVLAFEREELGA